MAALRALLICGFAATVLRLVGDRVAGALWNGYSFAEQSISKLSAVGAPTRPLMIAVDCAWGVLMLAFAWGVWRVAAEVAPSVAAAAARPGASASAAALRVTAALLAGNAAVTIIVALFVPAHYSGPGTSNTSIANVVVMAAGVVFYLLAMGFAAAALPGWFRVLSIGILVTYAVLTVVGILLSRGAPTTASPAVPGVMTGIPERTMSYSYVLWVTALAAALLRLSA